MDVGYIKDFFNQDRSLHLSDSCFCSHFLLYHMKLPYARLFFFFFSFMLKLTNKFLAVDRI